MTRSSPPPGRTRSLAWPASLSLLVLAASCDRPAPKPTDAPPGPEVSATAPTPESSARDESPDPSAPAATRRAPGPPEAGADELPQLLGKSEADLRTELGPPHDERTFTMGQCCHEFEIELYNTYPPGKGHDDVEIHEWTWTYDGYAVTVWFHRVGATWTALDTLHYDEGTEF